LDHIASDHFAGDFSDDFFHCGRIDDEQFSLRCCSVGTTSFPVCAAFPFVEGKRRIDDLAGHLNSPLWLRA